MKLAVRLSLLALVGASCGRPAVVVDSGVPDAPIQDAGPEVDAGVDDAGGADDAGAADAGGDAGVDAGHDDAGFDAGPPLLGCPVPSDAGPVFRVRAMAANLSSGNLQSYDPGEGARIIQGADPDIVMIQEFNYGSNSPTDITNFVNTTFDGGFVYQRGAGQIPNGVLSRWPIMAQGEWTDPAVSNRAFTWAHIDLPGPNDLWVVSVHLLTSSAGNRSIEATALVAQLQTNVPATDYLLLGGDFNTATRDPAVEAAFATFSTRFVTAGPFPVDQFATEGTNANRNKPYDNVLASPCLAQYQGPTVVGTSTFDHGLVIDTRGYSPLSDLAPALQTDSAASNMQHMGVLKDFFIQP